MAQGWQFNDSKEEKFEKIDAAAVLDEKRESPWAEPHVFEDPGRRVVGWRHGSSITKADQEKILKSERQARQEYLDARKAVAASQASSSSEPLAGLPPAWQAFWSTVPELDAQAAFKQFSKQKARREKETLQKVDEADATLLPISDESESVAEQAERFALEVRRRKEVMASARASTAEWLNKVGRARLLDQDEEEDRRRVSRKLDKSSYAHGVLQGKIRSSDHYFTFLYEDTQILHKKKVNTLIRANALMQVQINDMKGEVRQLCLVASETLPPPPEGGSLTGVSKGDSAYSKGAAAGAGAGAASGTEDEEGSASDANASAVGKSSGKVAP